jgi:phospholipid/cholesterol/gamma-HCH transport system permease protein
MNAIAMIRRIGQFTHFGLQLLARVAILWQRPKLVVEQVFNTGARSLSIIMLSGLFVGMVLGLQGYDLLRRFGSTESLGTAVALGLLRELGPVVTALLFAGRAGTALTSEIGLMAATDQLLAMDMMAVDPLKRIGVPRFLGSVISLPLLAAIFAVMGLTGAHLIGVSLMGVDAGQFWSQMRASVGMRDVLEGIIKSGLFGAVLGMIAVFEGFSGEPTPEGVGQATTRTVVVSSVAVLALDYLVTAVLL